VDSGRVLGGSGIGSGIATFLVFFHINAAEGSVRVFHKCLLHLARERMSLVEQVRVRTSPNRSKGREVNGSLVANGSVVSVTVGVCVGDFPVWSLDAGV